MGDHTATWLTFSLDTNANSASPDLCAKCKLKARGKEEYREGNGWTWLEQRRETGKGPRRTKKGIGIHHAWGLLQLLAAVAPMLACIAQIRPIATYVVRSVVCVSVFSSVVHRRLNQLRAGMGANSREPERNIIDGSAHRRHLTNMIERSVRGGDAALLWCHFDQRFVVNLKFDTKRTR